MKNDVFQMSYRDIILRDPIEEDAERYVRWHLLETEWQNWDAPWEEVEKDEKLLRDKILRIVKRDKPKVRTRLQLCFRDGTHIGAVSWYNKDNEEGKVAVGIDIPEKSFWGRSLGLQALELWIAYLFSAMEIDCIYTETWSGNIRMIRLAEKLGFEEKEREINKRDVRGKLYDGLAFILTRDKFTENRGDLMAYCAALNSD